MEGERVSLDIAPTIHRYGFIVEEVEDGVLADGQDQGIQGYFEIRAGNFVRDFAPGRINVSPVLHAAANQAAQPAFPDKQLPWPGQFDDIDAFLENYDVYAEWIGEAGTTPPQSLLGVNRLVLPELMVEIEAVAAE